MIDSTSVESSADHARTFKALADPTRLRILAHLSDGERCACRVQEALEVPANLLSHHLKVLRSFMSVARTRALLGGKREGVGNVLAAGLGVVTPTPGVVNDGTVVHAGGRPSQAKIERLLGG